MKRRRIVITGGHLTPALAVIEELRKRGGWEIYFFGRKYAAEDEKTPSAEWNAVVERKIRFLPLYTGRIQRKFTSRTIPAILKIPLGFFQSFWYLLKIKPRIILSFGGYLSCPVVIAGWLLGIPGVSHEQTTSLGLANKINAFFVKKIALSWKESLKNSAANKAVFTGNPIRRQIFKRSKKIWEILSYPGGLPFIFVTGGNQGSHTINQAIMAVLPQLVKIANVFHQCGHLSARGDFYELDRAKNQLPKVLRKRYHVRKYLLDKEMGAILNKADLVISRAGANIATEVAALGKPTIFIPIPWSSANEQEKNAQLLVDVGLAEILPQARLTPKNLLVLIEKMTKNLRAYQRNANKAKKLVQPDAAKKIADLAEEIAK